ncbi:MAG: hypothetical protein AB7O68_14785 [Pirellulales bacterium]
MSTRLTFKVEATNTLQGIEAVCARFKFDGSPTLNSKTWRGKAPRTCALIDISTKSAPMGAQVPAIIEVIYREPNEVHYLGKTRYEGWTTKLPDGPTEDGKTQQYKSHEVYGEMDFNEFDFGEFVGETEVEGVKRTTLEAVLNEASSGHFGTAGKSTFVASHRNRPSTKIVLSREPSGQGTDGWGTRIINLDLSTENFEQVLMERVTALMHDFMQGKASITNISSDNMTFVELSRVVVDCELNSEGQKSDFNVLHKNTPATFLEDLAKQIAAVYTVTVEVVDGKDGGLVLRHETAK